MYSLGLDKLHNKKWVYMVYTILVNINICYSIIKFIYIIFFRKKVLNPLLHKIMIGFLPLGHV